MLVVSRAHQEMTQPPELLLELTHTHTHKSPLFMIGDWNTKLGSQETPGLRGKFGLGVQNEGLQSFAKRTHWS